MPPVSGRAFQVSLHPRLAFSKLQAAFLLRSPVSHGANLAVYILGRLAGQ